MPPRAMKKKILSSVIQDEEIHLQFSFSSFFLWSVLALNAEVDDFIFFHSIGFFVGPISTRAWGYPELFSFGPIINSVKHQMDNLEEKIKRYTCKLSAWKQERILLYKIVQNSTRPNFGFHLVFIRKFLLFWISRLFDLADLSDLRNPRVEDFHSWQF